LKVYEESFDGHCLRAAYYYRDKLPHIDLECPLSVNSIKDTHPDLRQDSKPCTFALTYQGTANTLVNNLGLTLENAKSIEDNYHNLYHVSDEWVQDRLSQAELDGYVTVAFGLRVRTPILAQTLRNTKATPYEAQAEGRTAGNALGQSYGLLNNRAANEMQERILASPFRLDIKPCAHIHDAQYFILKDDVHVVEWFNKNLIECMSWQELPEIMHDVVKIGAELDIFYEGWHQPITLPNGATAEEISKVCAEGMLKYNKEKSICEN
jgi:DNA polymerase-1